MELFIIAAFIGLCFAVPILIPQLRENMRQKKSLRLGLLIALPILAFLFCMALEISINNGVYDFYYCLDGSPSDVNRQAARCDNEAVRTQYQRELLLQSMLPPPLRADEICWEAEAERFCQTTASPREWENYLSLLLLPATSGLTCFAMLWFFSRDKRKAKNGGEITP